MLRVSILIAAGVTGVLVGLLARPKKPARCFSIKRTKSELGYTFWILEGFGRHKCFILCDTWQEAIEEANRRLGAAPAAQKPDKPPSYADNGRRRPMLSHPMEAPVEPIAR
jgi:hypothetical protein